MLIAGSDDGVYRLDGVDTGEATSEQVLDAGSVMRLRRFDGVEGVFAATTSGLYHSLDAEEWTDLGVPREKVYSVAASPAGALHAGTRPAHVYTASLSDEDLKDLTWRERDDFQSLPSREEWRLPRHENLAQVRDLHVPAGAPDRVVAGVEVGGVHISEDGGETWTERRGAVHDDVHELVAVDAETFVAATGFGLFRTTDAGRSWTRLDEGFEQRYFRSALAVGETVYAGGALAHTSTWVEDDAAPALFVCRDGETLARVDHPRPDETVTGLAAFDGGVAAGTHTGAVMLDDGSGWSVLGAIPTADPPVSYTPLVEFES
jgi:hypothetical protein